MAGTTYVGLAIADSMFPSACTVKRESLTVEQARTVVVGAVSVCNPSHGLSLKALEQRHGIKVEVPEKAPRASLSTGDSIIVLSIRGLPRETREFTEQEVASATFEFGVWTVVA